MKTQILSLIERIVSVVLGVATLLWLGSFLASASGPIVYWHAANTGLPSDVQALAVAFPQAGTPGLSPTLYAGTWGSGVYRSVDHGISWQPVNTGITLPMSIQGGLAVNPVTPTILYAGDYYGGGLYRSENGGISWTLVLSDAAIQAVAVNPFTPTIVLAGDREEGLYRSVDWGDAWVPISDTVGLTDPHIQALAFASISPNVAYAGAAQLIFYSEDAGQTWAAKGAVSSTIQALVVHPVTPSLVYVGTFNNGLARSADWGATWTPLTNGLPANAWVTTLAINPVTPTVLYAGTWNGQVYRSTDGGGSWEELGYLGYVYSVLVHPTRPNIIYVATSNHSVFRGSTLDHLTIEPIDSPQYVNRPFPITLTAWDALGFPLTGTSLVQGGQAQGLPLPQGDMPLMETLAAGGYNGTAILTDTARLVSPTLVNLVNGVGIQDLVFRQPSANDVITAALQAEGLQVVSNPFQVRWYASVYLPMVVKIQ